MNMEQTTSELQARFGMAGVARFEAGAGGLTRLVLNSAQGEAEIYLHGAHVTRYRPAGQAEALFMSGQSWFEADKPIRGGVPICFPWFGPRAGHPQSPAHGFARLRDWGVEAVRQFKDGSVAATLKLASDDATRAIWPHDFEARYTVTVGSVLEMALEVRNTSPQAFTFEEALHTYFAVGDVKKVSVEGLEGTEYLDKVDQARRKVQGKEPITIVGETDRLYLNTRATCMIHDPAGARRFIVAKHGSEATVVWNPWIAKAKAMPDFGEDEWPGMICLEALNAADNAVTLEAGRAHVMRAIVIALAE